MQDTNSFSKRPPISIAIPNVGTKRAAVLGGALLKAK